MGKSNAVSRADRKLPWSLVLRAHTMVWKQRFPVASIPLPGDARRSQGKRFGSRPGIGHHARRQLVSRYSDGVRKRGGGGQRVGGEGRWTCGGRARPPSLSSQSPVMSPLFLCGCWRRQQSDDAEAGAAVSLVPSVGAVGESVDEAALFEMSADDIDIHHGTFCVCYCFWDMKRFED